MAETIGAVGNTGNTNNFQQKNRIETFERENATRGGNNTENSAFTKNTTEPNKTLAPPTKTGNTEAQGNNTVTDAALGNQAKSATANTTNTANNATGGGQTHAKENQRGANVDINI